MLSYKYNPMRILRRGSVNVSRFIVYANSDPLIYNYHLVVQASTVLFMAFAIHCIVQVVKILPCCQAMRILSKE